MIASWFAFRIPRQPVFQDQPLVTTTWVGLVLVLVMVEPTTSDLVFH